MAAVPDSLLFIGALLVALADQPSGPQPLRLGDIATVLPEADLVELVRVSGCGKATPWLVIGARGQAADVQFVEVFCAADAESAPVRRGGLAWVIRRVAPAGGWGAWALQSTHRYAQVVQTGRKFNDINGPRDPHRPIRIQGTVADEDVARIVGFLRVSPSRVVGTDRERVEGSWPVTRLTAQPEGTITAVVSKDNWESQEIMLRRTADGWEVFVVRYWIA